MHVQVTGWRFTRVPGHRGHSIAKLAATVLALALTGCSLDNLLKSDELPPDVTDPAIARTPQGAVAAYHGVVADFQNAFGGVGGKGTSSFVATTGVLSDELLNAGASDLDLRFLPEGAAAGNAGTEATYGLLHRVRALAGQAVGLLSRYVSDQPALQGHAYALAGYAEVFLAELFCSGVPLSTVDYTGDYTYQPGSTTMDAFTHARALFDSALMLAGGSARFTSLAAVGKARTLLALGDYAGAAAAVAAVPDDYRYEVSYTAAAGADAENFARTNPGAGWEFTVADREGTNGLDYRTSGDPRTAVTQRGSYIVGVNSYPIYHPNKYSDSVVTTDLTVLMSGADPLVLASGVEARLIEAEAALQAGDVTTWLAKLNHLRETAISPALADTTDPGSDAARVDLLFRERAFWLFLTGHRQGDLRRLIRQYRRRQDQVYPVGTYLNGTLGEQYDGAVTAPVPASESVLNPKFTGCISREA